MESEKSSCDLTPSMAPFLDVHMMSPLLDFLREVNSLHNLLFSILKLEMLSVYFLVW